jgi:cell division protease FtsH
MALGGRAAEEIIFSEITTGASNDLERVTATAKQMVMRFGMSEKLGPRVFGHDHGQPFLGREYSTEPDYSDEIAREIDEEVRRIIETQHARATKLLDKHRESLDTISQILVRRETIEKEQFAALLDGVPEAEVWGDDEKKTADLPVGPTSERQRARPAKRPLPRPGLAGGAAELHEHDQHRPKLD